MNKWFGLRKNGEEIWILHQDLMLWAYDHDMQFEIGWYDSVIMPDGTRLARNKKAAEERGWKDIAKAPFDE